MSAKGAFVRVCQYQNVHLSLQIWSVICILELLMYPIVALWPANRLAINIHHSIERNTLWVVLVVGESLISLVLPYLHCECEVEHYFTLIFSFALVYNIFKMYVRVQPDFESGLEQHALQGNLLSAWIWCILHSVMTFFIFLVGVNVKLVVIHSVDEQYLKNYAWCVCVCVWVCVCVCVCVCV